MRTLILCMILAGSASAQQVDGGSGSGERFAEINGEQVSAADFGSWLLDTHGWRYRSDFIILVLFRQEAARLGIELGPGELDAAFERFWRDQVLLRYGGNEERFLEELGRSGIDLNGYRRRHRAHLETQELGRRIILRHRTPADDDLARLYAELFPGGKRIHLRVAFFNRFRDFQERRTPSETALAELDAETRKRAEEFVAAVSAAPGSFGELVAEKSDLLKMQRHDSYVSDLRESQGELAHYQPKQFRGALEPLLHEAMQPGELLGPVFASTGFYVVQVVRHEDAPLDEVRDELAELFRKRPPTGREIYALREKLLKAASIDPPLGGD